MPMGTSHNQKAMNAALRILANRDHSKYELKLKLQHRGFTRQDIDAVILKCERFGYIDDRRTARVYIIQLKRKCFGRRYIRQALKKKRLMGAAIEKILSEDYPAEDEHQYARKLLDKKMKPFEHETDAHKRKDKMYRFLNSRGFSPAVIVELVK